MAFSETLKKRVRQKAHYRCSLCQAVLVEVHQIVPQAEGGSDEEENAAPLCASCHEIYGANQDHPDDVGLAALVDADEEILEGIDRATQPRADPIEARLCSVQLAPRPCQDDLLPPEVRSQLHLAGSELGDLGAQGLHPRARLLDRRRQDAPALGGRVLRLPRALKPLLRRLLGGRGDRGHRRAERCREAEEERERGLSMRRLAGHEGAPIEGSSDRASEGRGMRKAGCGFAPPTLRRSTPYSTREA